MILVDTNVIARLCNSADPLRPIARNALRSLRRGGPPLAVVPQVLFEFWVIATRPADQNGMDMAADRALPWMAHFRRTFQVLSDPPELLDCWDQLLRTYKTVGKPAHDARLVAAMQLHGISTILTFNATHFARYPITVVDPRTIRAI